MKIIDDAVMAQHWLVYTQGKPHTMFGLHHIKEGLIAMAREMQPAAASHGRDAARELQHAGRDAARELQHAGRDAAHQLVWVAFWVVVGILTNTALQAYLKG